MDKRTRITMRVEPDRKLRWQEAAESEERSLSSFISVAADYRAAATPPDLHPPAPPTPKRRNVRRKKRRA
jgi:hypothetical protein